MNDGWFECDVVIISMWLMGFLTNQHTVFN